MKQQSAAHKAQGTGTRYKEFKLQTCALCLVSCAFILPCSIMVVRQILALNVRVQILAGQQTC